MNKKADRSGSYWVSSQPSFAVQNTERLSSEQSWYFSTWKEAFSSLLLWWRVILYLIMKSGNTWKTAVFQLLNFNIMVYDVCLRFAWFVFYFLFTGLVFGDNTEPNKEKDVMTKDRESVTLTCSYSPTNSRVLLYWYRQNPNAELLSLWTHQEKTTIKTSIWMK